MGQKKIVYIEDDHELVNLVALILERKGYQVCGVTDGVGAFEAVMAHRPDLILLDLMIPEVDGWDIYRQLTAEPATREIPVIVISAKSQPVDRVLGLHIAGVDAYLCKPFKPVELVETVNRLVPVSDLDPGTA